VQCSGHEYFVDLWPCLSLALTIFEIAGGQHIVDTFSLSALTFGDGLGACHLMNPELRQLHPL
jgi:hypothetical protein